MISAYFEWLDRHLYVIPLAFAMVCATALIKMQRERK